ncbi:MAG: FAD-dependent oxidoreductase [Caldilineaceae bacterium]
MTESYDIAVIGNGMIGAAAARHLSATGATVAAIGPHEPENWKTHSGVFASHYDQGRITRIIDPDAIWGTLGKRSMERYSEIEEKSGIRFHGAAGCLRVSPDTTEPNDTLLQAEAVGRQHDASYTVEHTDEGLNEIFPFLHFPEGSTALWERGGAGYVNPRQLVQAQLAIAAKQGTTIIPEAVVALNSQNGIVTLSTAANRQLTAKQVLISAGAYSGWLTPQPLVYQRKAVTVVLAALAPAEAERLRAIPSIIYRLANHPNLFSIYSLPPVRYPDGKIYLKIGGPLHEPILLDSPTAIQDWFHGDGNPVEATALREVLFAMVPNLQADAVHSRPCVVTYTEHGYPYIGQVAEQIYVATGGCGSAAKSSDEIGRIGALLVENHGGWQYDLPATHFTVCFQPS